MRPGIHIFSALLFLTPLSIASAQMKGSDTVIAQGEAIVLDLSGSLEAQDANQHAITLHRETLLAQGTTISTRNNAHILLRLDDGSEVLLGSNARMLLEREQSSSGATLFELLLGRLKAIVTKRYTGMPSFQLGTPTAIIAVRGTKFYVEVSSHNVTEVDVENGLVEVSGRDQPNMNVLLKPGYSTRVGPDMRPELPSPTENMRPDAREQQQESGQEHGAQGERNDPNERPEQSPQEPKEVERPN